MKINKKDNKLINIISANITKSIEKKIVYTTKSKTSDFRYNLKKFNNEYKEIEKNINNIISTKNLDDPNFKNNIKNKISRLNILNSGIENAKRLLVNINSLFKKQPKKIIILKSNLNNLICESLSTTDNLLKELSIVAEQTKPKELEDKINYIKKQLNDVNYFVNSTILLIDIDSNNNLIYTVYLNLISNNSYNPRKIFLTFSIKYSEDIKMTIQLSPVIVAPTKLIVPVIIKEEKEIDNFINNYLI